MMLWESSAFWGIAGIIGGIVVATFFFVVQRKIKILEYQVDSTKLITDEMINIPGIKITLDSQPVRNLTSTTIKFTNSGNQTITSDDFATLAPLGISVTGRFFNIQHGYHTTSDNPNSIPFVKTLDDKTVNIEFDFLKQKQSCSITILHDGALSVLGELKSGKIRKHKDRKISLPPLCAAFVCIIISFVSIITYTYCATAPNRQEAYINNMIDEYFCTLYKKLDEFELSDEQLAQLMESYLSRIEDTKQHLEEAESGAS